MNRSTHLSRVIYNGLTVSANGRKFLLLKEDALHEDGQNGKDF